MLVVLLHILAIIPVRYQIFSFLQLSRLALGTTQPLLQSVPELYPGSKTVPAWH